MKIVVNSKKEAKIVHELQNFLLKQDIPFITYEQDPFSFIIEDLFDELCNCYVEVDKNEESTGVLEEYQKKK